MIGQDLAAFLESAVMTIVASRDSAMRATIGRGVGTQWHPDGAWLDTMISRAQWPEVIGNLEPGAPVALTFVQPADYIAYQIKGRVTAVTAADAADQALSRHYIDAMAQALAALGVARPQISRWMTDRDLMRVRYRPCDLFLQTPGPRAGTRASPGI